MMVMIEKHVQGLAIRFYTGILAGKLVTDNINGQTLYFDLEHQVKLWCEGAGVELVRTHSSYRNFEIVKGASQLYVFTFDGRQVMIGYPFKKLDTVIDLIDWHYDNVPRETKVVV